MIRKGSLVRYAGESKAIPGGKYLLVHDLKDGKVVVWLRGDGKWKTKTIDAKDVEEVVE